MNSFAPTENWSSRQTLVFWWVLFLVMQFTERVFLLGDALSVESSSWENLVMTLVTGFRADLITATIGIVVAWALASGVWLIINGFTKVRGVVRPAQDHGRLLWYSSFVVALVFLGVLTLDMGYYAYNHQHLDLVFFQYLDDLLAQSPEGFNQAKQQTGAELQKGQKWGFRLLTFFMMEGIVVGGWLLLFTRGVLPRMRHWKVCRPALANGLIAIGVLIGLTGFHPYSMWAIRSAPISSSVYYTLAQNPIWYGGEVFLGSLVLGLDEDVSSRMTLMPLEDAVVATQALLDPDAEFPFPEFPLVRKHSTTREGIKHPPLNVLVLFIEGLDRRYLGRTIDMGDQSGWAKKRTIPGTTQIPHADQNSSAKNPNIRLTPFLDRLRTESVYFEHFFSNGSSTPRGLFATFCSLYPREGWDVIRTRYAQDFLCLPSLLSNAGYRTEMVIAQSKGSHRGHLGLFMARNGLDRLLDVEDFPSDAQRLGIGITDEELFRILHARLRILQENRQPFFLSTLTVGTHHPYPVPPSHPEVRALMKHPDGYVAALKCLDVELEKFLTGLQKEGLLKNTAVFILGDHGRHEWLEGGGGPNVLDWVGHFMTPLYIWIDESLRNTIGFRPRTVSIVASQVDLTPTILGMNGLMPRMAPFLGRDLSCMLEEDCWQGNMAIVKDNARFGLADQDGFLGYSMETQTFLESDLEFTHPSVLRTLPDGDLKKRYRWLLALDVSSQVLLDQNRIWSWDRLGNDL